LFVVVACLPVSYSTNSWQLLAFACFIAGSGKENHKRAKGIGTGIESGGQ
jgi:hypothetical protein